jgi:adenine C2-methylase RlmN of 23S rRNA A2503 and tRNA A37
MTAIIRKSKGQDISAACGQLRVDKKDKQNVKSLR